MKLIYLLIFTLLFSGCDLFESQADKQAKLAQEKASFEQKIKETKDVQMKQIDAQTTQELEKIKAQKELAQLQKEQMMEKIRLEAELEKQKAQLEIQKQEALLAQKMKEIEQANSMELKKYLLLILFLILIIASFFTYYYFKKRHDDKLRAYQDNLDKYFHQQENATKMRIAEKIIDTVASGKLDKAQETELIKALSGNISPTEEPKLLEGEITEEVELLEEKK
jgi:multidrug efflux pump subunit AcrA (membrane-fusion protein)